MRTDSVNLASVAQEQIIGFVQKTYGKEYAEPRTYKTKSKNAQEAHEAIRPTDATKESAGSNEDQKKLYRLIRERTIASQMADAKLMRTKITATTHLEAQLPSGNTGVTNFSATGSRVIFNGWLTCDSRARGEDVELPKVNISEALTLKEAFSEEKHTEPLPRYSEAGLIKELEKRGIGRPSTYASIIKTLYDRKYVEKEGRSLKPTDTGDVVSSFLEEYLITLKDFYGPFHKDVKAKEEIAKLTNLGAAPDEWKCPVCGSPMIIKLSRGGKFMSCERYPDCTGARRIDGSVVEPNKSIGTDEKTGLPIFVMEGRFGPYVQLGEKTKENPKPPRSS